MYKLNESEKEYRFGDSGPKYLMRGPRANLGLVLVKPGQDLDNHLHHIMEENFYMLEGQLEFTIGSETITASTGDLIHVEPGESHYLRNLGDCDAKAIFVLTPFQEMDKVTLEKPE